MGIAHPNSSKIIQIYFRDRLSNCKTSYSYSFASSSAFSSKVTDKIKKNYLNENPLTPTIKRASFTP